MSQDGLAKAFEMLLNPGDSILVEDPTYPGTLSFLGPFGANLIRMSQMDELINVRVCGFDQFLF